MSALDLPVYKDAPLLDPVTADAQAKQRNINAQQVATQQREAQTNLEIARQQHAARIENQQALGQTLKADAAQWANTPQYQGQDWVHAAPEVKAHFIDPYSEVADQIPSAWNAAQRMATGNPDIGVPKPPVGAIESRSINPAGEVHRSYQVDPTAIAQESSTPGDPLANLPQGEASLAREISEYRYPYTALSRMPPIQRTRILNAITQVNPDFDANQYSTRQATMHSFASGQDAANIASANTVIGHLADFLKAGADLKNGGNQWYNWASNTAERINGNPAQTTFQQKADAVASEMSKLFKGTGSATDQEIKEWRKNLDPNMSPQQIQAAAQSAMELMSSRLNALKTKYENGMGKPMDRPILNPRSRSILRQNGLEIPEAAATENEDEQQPAPQIASATSTGAQLSDQDKAALAWANANPKDPRSAAIKGRLGFK